MRSRRYNKRLEILQTGEIPDGFGGSTFGSQSLGKFWGEIKTVSNDSRLSSLVSELALGDIDPTKAIIINCRKRIDIPYNPINQFIRYKGIDYTIQTVTEKDFNRVDIQIIAVADRTENTPIINTGPNTGFPFTLPLTLT